MSLETLGVGLWGLGAHARRNLIPAFAASTRVQLVALHTRNPQVLNDIGDETGANPYGDPEALLTAPEVDVVYIATPTGLHSSAALKVLEAGKHVWCEKPLTDSLERTETVVSAAIGSGLVALESDMFLHHPQFARLREVVGSGRLGLIRSAVGRFGFPHRDSADFRYSEMMGGGAALDAGFYPLTAALALLGRELTVRGAVLESDPGFDVDTGGSALLTTDAQAAFLDWGFGRSYRSEIEVWCEDGTVYVDRAYAKPADLETEVVIRHQSGEVEVLPIGAANHFALMLDEFAAVTSGDTQYVPDRILTRARLMAAIRDVGVARIAG